MAWTTLQTLHGENLLLFAQGILRVRALLQEPMNPSAPVTRIRVGEGLIMFSNVWKLAKPQKAFPDTRCDALLRSNHVVGARLPLATDCVNDHGRAFGSLVIPVFMEDQTSVQVCTPLKSHRPLTTRPQDNQIVPVMRTDVHDCRFASEMKASQSIRTNTRQISGFDPVRSAP
jgi:hypothetical protein